jgi:hypothetical protein
MVLFSQVKTEKPNIYHVKINTGTVYRPLFLYIKIHIDATD